MKSVLLSFEDERARVLRSFQPAARFEIVASAGRWVQYNAADRFNSLLAEIVRQRMPGPALTTADTR